MDMKCVINVDNNVEWYGIEMLFYEDSNNKIQSKRLTHGLRYKIVEQNFQMYSFEKKNLIENSLNFFLQFIASNVLGSRYIKRCHQIFTSSYLKRKMLKINIAEWPSVCLCNENSWVTTEKNFNCSTWHHAGVILNIHDVLTQLQLKIGHVSKMLKDK